MPWYFRLFLAPSLLVALVAVVGCVGMPTPSPTFTTTPTRILPALQMQTPKIYVSAIPEQATYIVGKPINIEFRFSNTDTEPITISPFPPDIKIVASYSAVPDISVRSFAGGEGEVTLGSKESKTYNFTWDQQDDNKKQVSPGLYYIGLDISITTTTGGEGLSTGATARVVIQTR